MISHLLGIPAGPHAEQQPTCTELIQRCNLFGEHDGVMLGWG